MLILKASALQMRMDRGMSNVNNFQQFIFLLLKRRWIQKLVFEDGGVQNISRIKNLPDTNNCFSAKHRQP